MDEAFALFRTRWRDAPAGCRRLVIDRPDGRRDERFFSAASHRTACSSNRARRQSSERRSSSDGPPSRNIEGRKRIASTSSTTNCAGLESVVKRASWPRPERPEWPCPFYMTSISWRTRLSWSSSKVRPRKTSSTKRRKSSHGVATPDRIRDDERRQVPRGLDEAG